MKVFDSHSHFFVIFKEFYLDFLKYTALNGLSGGFINSDIGDEASFSSFFRGPELKNLILPHITVFTALHPWKTESAEKWAEFAGPELEKKLQKNKNLFIGETGLDRLRGADIETQKEIFRSHIELALSYERPFTIHCVREWGNCTDILNEYFSGRGKKRIPFIVHGFSGSAETMKILTGLGGYISFSAAMIIKGHVKTLENIRKADRERILIETDFPYSAADRHGEIINFKNGKEAGMLYMEMIKNGYLKTAETLDISVEKLCGIIEENGKIFKNYTDSR